MVRDGEGTLGGSFERSTAGTCATGGASTSRRATAPGQHGSSCASSVPGLREEVRAQGGGVRRFQARDGGAAPRCFADLPLQTELAIARFLESARP